MAKELDQARSLHGFMDEINAPTAASAELVGYLYTKLSTRSICLYTKLSASGIIRWRNFQSAHFVLSRRSPALPPYRRLSSSLGASPCPHVMTAELVAQDFLRRPQFWMRETNPGVTKYRPLFKVRAWQRLAAQQVV